MSQKSPENSQPVPVEYLRNNAILEFAAALEKNHWDILETSGAGATGLVAAQNDKHVELFHIIPHVQGEIRGLVGDVFMAQYRLTCLHQPANAREIIVKMNHDGTVDQATREFLLRAAKRPVKEFRLTPKKKK